MKAYWIIGGGRFGLRAAETLGCPPEAPPPLVVEKDPRRCRELARRGLATICGDGVPFLLRGLKRPEQPVWIVAAVPLHLAFQWLRAKLDETARVEPWPIPDEFFARLPNAVRGSASEVYASNADFICPPSCSEAGRLCTATGRRRPRRMDMFLTRIEPPGVKILVVRSFQLAPGVGGLRPRDLFGMLDAARGACCPLLIATACKCHAVISGLRVILHG